MNESLKEKYKNKGVVGWLLYQLDENRSFNDDGEAFYWRFLPLLDKFPDHKPSWEHSNIITDFGFNLLISTLELQKFKKLLYSDKIDQLLKDVKLYLKDGYPYCSIYNLHKSFEEVRLKFKGDIGKIIEAGFWSTRSSPREYGETPCRQINNVAELFTACAKINSEQTWNMVEKAILKCLEK